MLEGCTPWPPQAAARYRQAGYWRGEVLGDLLRAPAAAQPDRPAVLTRTTSHSYGELDARADRLAAGLYRLGLRPGDRVVVQLPNTVDFVLVCVALFRLGALPVLALPAHRRAEIGYLVDYSGAVALVTADVAGPVDLRVLAREVKAACPGLRHVLVAGDPAEFTALAAIDAPPRELPRPDPGDVAFFLLSGGTTGLPKLIPRTHEEYAYQLRATSAAMGLDRDQAYLAALPVAHNAALGCPGVLGALWVGARAVLARSPSPDEVFGLIRAHRVRLTTVMPAVLSLWLETAPEVGADLSGMVLIVGGAPLDPDLGRRVRPVLGATLSHWFGMAEGILCFTRLDDGDEVAATTAGTPLCPDDELLLVADDDTPVPAGQVGHLLVRGPCVLRGYYAVPEHNRAQFTADGYLRTGDLARLTPAGQLVITGRSKDVINRGGEKISADEVEAHLLAHPAISAAAVVPVPDRRLGERVGAVVVPVGDAPALEAVRVFLRERGLAEFKLPDRLDPVPELPRTRTGTVDRRALAAVLARPTG